MPDTATYTSEPAVDPFDGSAIVALAECPACGTGPWGGENAAALQAILAEHAAEAHPDEPVQAAEYDACAYCAGDGCQTCGWTGHDPHEAGCSHLTGACTCEG